MRHKNKVLALSTIAVVAGLSSSQAVEAAQYVVKPGDNLYRISLAHNTTVDALKAANGIRTNNLQVGDVLQLPNGGSAVSPAPTPSPTPTPSVAPAGTVAIRKEQVGGVYQDLNQAIIQAKALYNEALHDNWEVSWTPQGYVIILDTKVGQSTDSTPIPSRPSTSAPTPSRPNTTIGNYIVQEGDSFWKIAHKFGVSVDQLKRWNHKNNNLLQVGDKIIVSADGGSVSAPTPSTPQTPSIQGQALSTQQIQSLVNRYPHYKILEQFYSDLNSAVAAAKASYNETQYNNWIVDEVGGKYVVYLEPKPGSANTSVVVPSQPAAPAPSRPSTTGSSYTVKAGDSLWKIAHQYGVTVDQLKQWNHKAGNALQVGDKLVVKASGQASSSQSTTRLTPATQTANSSHYRVQAGDTLWAIASRNGVSVQDLIKKNNLWTTLVQPGQQLRIH